MPYAGGELFVGAGNGGTINQYLAGNLIATLSTGALYNITGMCFDAQGDLYATNFTDQTITKFDDSGHVLAAQWAFVNGARPESCVVDSKGDVYVGTVDAAGTQALLRYTSSGTLSAQFYPAVESRGIDWIDLSQDNCTIFYTSEGHSVKRFNVCSNSQEADFASGLSGYCYALKIRPNGEVMVSCSAAVVRLSSSGSIIQTYPTSTYGEGSWFALALSPDDSSFWVGDINSKDILQIAINSGTELLKFNDPSGVAGMAVFGANGPIGGPYTPAETLGGGNPSENSVTCNHGQFPVGCAFGDFWHSFRDTSVPGRGPSLNLTRTYNSLDASSDGPFGFGWSSSYTMSLTTDASTGDVVVHQENGAQTTFTPTGSGGGYTAPPRVIATLVHNSDGTFTFTRHHRSIFVFSSGGMLLSEQDLNGYTTTLGYNTPGQLTTVTDPAGRTLTFSYGANGKVASVTDPGGRTLSYGYDGAGNLTSVTDVAGGVTRFAYDGNHLMTSMTDPNGGVLSNVYDSSGRVTSQTDPMQRTTTYVYADWGTTITSPNGNVTVERFVDGELTRLTRASGTPAAASWQYTYDRSSGEVATVTDPNGNATSYSYDQDGNATQIVDPLGRTTTAAYNGLDEPTAVTNASGVTTTRTYDGDGNLLSVSRPLGSSGTQTTIFHYDDSAHPDDLTSTTDALGKTTRYSYDTYGDLVSIVDPLGDTATYTYNILGERTAAVSARGNASGADPTQYTTTYRYDAFGDLVKTTDPLGDVTSQNFDGNRNRTSVTDANGRQTTYAYNADNEATAATRADGTTLSYGYDGDGNQTSQTDGAGRTTSYGYDPLDRLTSVTDPLGRKTSYSYDAAGNRTQVTDPTGQTTTFGYDKANQLTSIAYSDSRTHAVSFSYTPTGLRATMTDGTGETDYSYDSLNRLTSVKNGAGQTVTYAYDLQNQLTSLTYPNGKAVSRTYDDAGRLTAVTDWLNNTTRFGYDADGNLTGISYPNGLSDTRSYDHADRLTKITDGNGTSTLASFAYTRDANGQPLTATTTGLGQPTQSYGYNSLNQLQSLNSTSYAYDAADNPTSIGTASLGYDAANEATSYTTAATTTTLAYDARGNRLNGLTSTGAAATYSYDQANRLTQVTTGAGTSSATGLMAAGATHSLAVTNNGNVWAWGGNRYGQLGNGTTTDSAIPVQVPGLSNVVAVAAGDDHSVALENDGTVTAWGVNKNGELGNGTTASSSAPVSVTDLSAVTAIAAGGGHTLALRSDGTVAAWGTNNSGELGIGTTKASDVPVSIGGLDNVVAVAAGSSHSLALRSDGTVWAWGANKSGQLGNGTNTNSSTPIQVPGLTNMVAVAAGGDSSYALRADGTIWAWGLNGSGQLGNGSSTHKSETPVQVSLSGVTFIAAGASHALAITGSGSVYAWGQNTSGQLGDGGACGHNCATPVQVQSLSGAVAVAGGANHSLASTTAGLVYAWGENGKGELGDGTTTNSSTPVEATGLTGVKPSAQPSFGYNGDGLRMSKTSAGVTLHFAWDHSGVLPHLLADGTTDYVYGPGDMQLEQIDESSGSVLYFNTDQLGSTRLLTDSAGAVAATYSYNGYGTTTSHTGTASTNLQYAGQYLDRETGLYYLRARYYDPQSGQFLTRDPLTPTTQAPYTYAGDNPVDGVDPSGLICLSFHCFVHDTVMASLGLAAGAAVVAAAPEIAIAGAGVELTLTADTLTIDLFATETTIPELATQVGNFATNVGLTAQGTQALYSCLFDRSKCESALKQFGASFVLSRLEIAIDDWKFSLLARSGELGYDLFSEKLHQEIAWLQHPSPQCP